MKRKNLKIGPAPGDEFEMLLFVLTQEVSFARVHLQIARGLSTVATDKPHILHAAQFFFAFTFRARLESAHARAARLFDPMSGTATIPAMVRTAEQKAGTFQFAKPAEVRKKVTIWEARIDSGRPVLAKLHDLRNGLIAHLDKNVILNPQEMSRTVSVTFDEINQILGIAKVVVTGALDGYNNSAYVDELLLPTRDYEALFRILESNSSSAAPRSRP